MKEVRPGRDEQPSGGAAFAPAVNYLTKRLSERTAFETTGARTHIRGASPDKEVREIVKGQ